MEAAKSGDTVRVHYTGKLEDGTVFDSSVDREPLEFTIGSGQVIPGVEQAVAGMTPGEQKSAEIAPEDGYGPRRDDMVAVVPRKELPDDLNPTVGQQLAVKQDDGQAFNVTVTETSEQSITVDANHALAGRSLIFDLQLVEVL